MMPSPSSPTISSVSSSDVDTESTGSFFHETSITLGTLMGVSFPAIAFRAVSHQHASPPASLSRAARFRKKKQEKGSAANARSHRRRSWWRLCRDEDYARPSSLGEYLEVERRFSAEAFYRSSRAELAPQPPRNGRKLFADERVLPPAVAEAEGETPPASTKLCSFPVALSGICSGGAE